MFEKNDKVYIEIPEEFTINGSIDSSLDTISGLFNRMINDVDAEIICDDERFIIPLFCLKVF